MGVTQVTATVRNPAEPWELPVLTWEGLFLVDTGAIDSLAPRQHLEAIGLKPKGQRVYGLADRIRQRPVRLDVTTGDIEFMGDIVGSTIVFGEDDSEPLLGLQEQGDRDSKARPSAKTVSKSTCAIRG